MKTVNIKKNTIINILTGLLSLIMIIAFFEAYSFLKVLVGDDIVYAGFLASFDFGSLYTYADHGNIITSFLGKFLVHILPRTLNFHPLDFAYPYGLIIRILFIVFNCYILASTSCILRKRDYSFLIFYTLSFFVYLAMIYKAQDLIMFYAGLMRFGYPLIILSLFMHMFICIYYRKSIVLKKNLFLYCCVSFLLGLSNEIIIPCIFLFFISLISIEIYDYYSKHKKFPQITFNKKYKEFYMLIISFLAGITIYLANPMFYTAIRCKTSFNYTFSQYISMLPEYTNAYFSAVFINHRYEWLLFILSIILIKLLMKNSIKLLRINVCFMSSILIYLYSLLLCGKTHYGGGYWIEHNIIHSTLTFYVYLLIFLNMGIVLKKLNKLKFKNYFIIIILALLFIFTYKNCNIFKQYLYVGNHSQEEVYLLEKAVLYQHYNNEKIILPVDLIQKNLSLDKDTQNIYINYYIRIVYGIEPDTSKIIFGDEKLMTETFLNSGGTITQEELKQHKFKILYDKDFVLGKKNLSDIKK